jgi:hypothetical protein
MLRIRKSEEGAGTNFALSGQIGEEHVAELQTLVEGVDPVSRIAFDLQEVRLVDREAVRFLAHCETRGIKLKNCPSYVREWIERGGTKS